MSKTFKSSSQANDNRTLSVEKLYGEPRLMISGDVQMGFLLDPSDAPALALAILEAAGYKGILASEDPDNLIEKAYSAISIHIAEQERATAEAKEQAELEAEALELFNTLQTEIHGNLGPNWVPVTEFPSNETKRKWLAVARKAREMRAEK